MAQGNDKEESVGQVKAGARSEHAAETAGSAVELPEHAEQPNEQAELTEPEFPDSLFRKQKKNGEWKIVDAPDLGVVAVDAHCHLQYQKNPGLALARAGLNGVAFMCTVVDVFEDGMTAFDNLRTWNHEAALSMQRLFSRC